MRTDRTQLCAHCALRMSRRERACPQCHGTLHDLTRPSDRRSAMRLFTRGASALLPWRAALDARRVVVATVVGFAVSLVFVVVTGGAAAPILAFVAMGVLCVLATHIAGRKTEAPARVLRPARASRRILLLPEGRAPDGPIVVRGEVRVTAPIVSPLAGVPCAAWRVVGESSKHAIDDAQTTSFEVVGDAGGPVRVEVGTALVLVATKKTPPRPLDEAMQAWLAERAVDAAHADLEEGVIVEGDHVLVCAPVFREEPGAASGFRDAARIRVVEGTAQHPLRIERL